MVHAVLQKRVKEAAHHCSNCLSSPLCSALWMLRPLNIGFLDMSCLWRAQRGPERCNNEPTHPIGSKVLRCNSPNSLVIRYSWSMSDSPGKSGSPHLISEKRQPTAQMSTSLGAGKGIRISTELCFFYARGSHTSVLLSVLRIPHQEFGCSVPAGGHVVGVGLTWM